MKNIPEKIYLLVEDENIDFLKSKGGIASTTRINKNDLLYLRSNKSKFVYLVVGVTNNVIYGCFQKEKSAERYVGNNERYFIKKIEVV
jgi:hypothetical protein